MQKNKILATLGLALLTPAVWASEPIADLNAFEASYIACLEQKLANDCLAKTLLPHGLPWASGKGLEPVDDMLRNWIGDDSLYKAHPIAQQAVGDLIQRRSYLLERDSGRLMLVSMRLRAVKGRWYYSDMSVSNDEKVLAEVTLGNALTTTP